MKIGYVCYADWESILVPQEEPRFKKFKIEEDTGEISSFSKNIKEHIPSGYALTIVDYKGEIFLNICTEVKTQWKFSSTF